MNLGHNSPVVVIGAQGQMGQRFVSAFIQHGSPVTQLDHPLDMHTLAQAVPQAALVLLCVPITAMAEVIRAVAPYLGPQTILADICSVKIGPLNIMLEATTTPVVGTHPLFGPQTSAEELRIAITPGRDELAASQVAACFRDLGFTPFMTTAQEHDRAMAYIQGLNFVTTVAYLCASPELAQLEQFFTPSFARRMAAATKMITEDAALFTNMFEANPHSLEAVRLFRSYLNVAAGGDLELLSQKALWWWQKKDDSETPNS